MKPAHAMTAVAVLACACATTDPYRFDGPRSGAGVGLAPYAVREECFRLDPGDRVDFYFWSTAPLAFNIHYHDVNAVVMPIDRPSTNEESGELIADRREIYCLMWEAAAEPALIDYRVRPLPRRP
jgi:hypothetical protein